MRAALAFLYAFLCLLGHTSALYILPDLPSEDDFYTTPDDINDYAEGEIIKWRASPLVIRSVYIPINVKNAWQFLIRSTDSRGNATAVVTTVMEPYDADPSKVLSYQIAEDSSNIDCSPSYAVLFGAKANLEMELEMLLLETGLSRGWYVVMPDYEGTQSSFTAGKQSGHATLDSIRAVLQSGNTTGINSDAKVAMWGYSGGTIASGWAATMQPSYAPELKDNLIGVAMGGWVTNVTLTALATDGTLFAGLIPLAINGLLNEYSEYVDILKEDMSATHFLSFSSGTKKCLIPAAIQFAFHDFFKGLNPYFKDGVDFFLRPIIAEIITNNTLGLHESAGVPEIPVFVFHGTKDEIVPFSGAQRVYENFCEWGIDSFEFAVSNTTGHILEVIEGSGAAIKWLEDRFAGKDAVSGCKRTVRETNLSYPGADLSVYQLISTLVDLVFGESIGDLKNRNVTSSPEILDFAIDMVEKLVTKIGPISF